MKRPRPHIPIDIRLLVAKRQFEAKGGSVTNFFMKMARQHGNSTRRQRLTWLLEEMFSAPPQLDHDPALILRPYVDGYYSPDANDPLYLIYRERAEHQQKTTGRRPGAERTITTKGSDVGLKTKFARLERRKVDTSDIPEAKKGWFKKAKLKMPSRPFPKGRGFSKP